MKGKIGWLKKIAINLGNKKQFTQNVGQKNKNDKKYNGEKELNINRKQDSIGPKID